MKKCFFSRLQYAITVGNTQIRKIGAVFGADLLNCYGILRKTK